MTTPQDWSPGPDGGYNINPRLYRVPDLLDERAFIAYMWTTYGVNVEFKDASAGPPSGFFENEGQEDQKAEFEKAGLYTGPVDVAEAKEAQASDKEDEELDEI